jgi:asparagine synthase (glutamine-hydrolysing)
LLPGGEPLAQLGDKLHKAAGVMTAHDVADVHRRLLCHWPDPAALVSGATEPRTVFDEAADAMDGIPDILRMQGLDFVGYLADDILAKVDRAAMSTSLETRVPFLHTGVMDLAWSMPTQHHLHQGQSKALLRAVLHRHVPKTIIERPKMGFGVPLAHWLRGPLRDWSESLLSEESLNRSNCLTAEPIRTAWSEHLSGKRNHAYRLWDALMFQAWHEQTATC